MIKFPFHQCFKSIAVEAENLLTELESSLSNQEVKLNTFAKLQREVGGCFEHAWLVTRFYYLSLCSLLILLVETKLGTPTNCGGNTFHFKYNYNLLPYFRSSCIKLEQSYGRNRDCPKPTTKWTWEEVSGDPSQFSTSWPYSNLKKKKFSSTIVSKLILAGVCC